MKLHEFQQEFASAIVANTPGAVADGIRAAGISAGERLSVYHHNVVGNLVDALAETFSATQKLVGEEFFRGMARQFVPASLPVIANLNVYGADFPAFIEAYAPARELPYLAEVARFEWLWHEAYLAPDDAALMPRDVAQLAPDDYPGLRIRLRSSARLLAADYPVDAIWRWCEDGGEADAPDMGAGDHFLLLVRPALDVQIAQLSAAEYRMLLSLSAGDTFEAAAGYALEEDAGFDLAAFLKRHFALQTFQSFLS